MPSISKETQRKARLCDRLLSLLWDMGNEADRLVISSLVELQNHSNNAAELFDLAKREKRYEWRKVGNSLHLFPAHEKKKTARSVAMIVKDGKSFNTLITAPGRRTVTGNSPTMTSAKKAVESEFSILDAE